MRPPHSHPKANRLRTKQDFRHVIAEGAAFPGAQILVRRVATTHGRARLGISCPRKYGKAVLRNRFRRLVREAFRGVCDRLGSHDYHVSPRRGLEHPTLERIRADLLRTLTASPAPPRGGTRRRTHTREDANP